MLSKKEFTNGADSATVINLYRDTATALLGSTKELSYSSLEWSEAQFERLGEALCYCGALETLEVMEMELSDTAAAAVVAGLASCTSLKTLPDLSASLQIPMPHGLPALKLLPHGAARPVGAHVAADARPHSCRSLTALPDLSALTSLQTLDLSSAAPSRRCPTSRRSPRCRRSASKAAGPSRRCPRDRCDFG